MLRDTLAWKIRNSKPAQEALEDYMSFELLACLPRKQQHKLHHDVEIADNVDIALALDFRLIHHAKISLYLPSLLILNMQLQRWPQIRRVVEDLDLFSL